MSLKKTTLVLGLLLGLTVYLNGQPHLKVLQEKNTTDYKSMVEQIEKELNNQPDVRHEKQFRRWQMMVDPYIGSNGKLSNYPARNLREFSKNKLVQSAIGQRSTHGHWLDVTPTEFAIQGNPLLFPNTGRVNVVVVHPTNANIIFVGASMGGLWKSADGGNSWVSLTDGLPVIGVSALVIHPTQPDTMWMLTGDAESGFIPSIGILKTYDGGYTWQSTAVQWDESEEVYGNALVMNPVNPYYMILATSIGVFHTTSGWIQSLDTYVGPSNDQFTAPTFDVQYHPTLGSTSYASTSCAVFRSINWGSTWYEVDTWPCNSHRIELAVTPHAPDRLYALSALQIVGNGYVGLYVSPDKGGTWNQYTDTVNIVGDGTRNQILWDLSLAVDPADSNKVYVGGVMLFKSTNGGQMGSWDTLNSAGLHPDIHDVVFGGSTVYVGCDGGLAKSTDGGLNFVNLSEGMNLMQVYDMDAEDGRVIVGTQDTGSSLWDIGDTEAERVSGADGFECMLHYTDTNIIYASTQNNRARSLNGGTNFNNITPPGHGNPWGSSWIMHPTNASQLYCAFDNIARTANGGSSWDTMANPGMSGQVLAMAQGVSDPDVFYASNRRKLVRTDDIHAAVPVWTDVTANFPFDVGGLIPDSMQLGGIAVDPANPQRVWITLRGYSPGNKVFFSGNGGGSWTNVTGGLANVPFYTIVYQAGSGDGIYVCSDIGVFYRNSSLSDWIYWSNGLPVIRIEDLSIDGGYIYAGTLGRGVWRSALYTACPVSLALSPANDPSSPNSTGYQIYHTSQWLTSSRVITGGLGTEVYYNAGNYVDMKPGFWAKELNFMEAKVGGCPN